MRMRVNWVRSVFLYAAQFCIPPECVAGPLLALSYSTATEEEAGSRAVKMWKATALSAGD